jgi:beta-mannanase
LSCAVAPVSPNATQQAKNLLCYLYSIYKNRVLSGQQETSWSDPAGDISWYASNGMKYPAILGGDFLYSDGGGPTSETTTTQRAIAYWKAGGITMIRYHMGMPPNPDSYANAMATPTSPTFYTDVITSGTAENTSFLAKLDYMAYQIGVMKAANVAVILALFHEAQPGGWFWWSKGTGAQYVALWNYAFNYLTATKGLNNIVWLMPFSSQDGVSESPASFYPGKAVVDVTGPDYTGTAANYTKFVGIAGSTIPLALHESGELPDPTTLFPTAAPWVLFNTWAGYEKSANTLAHVQQVFADPHVITRDEVPDLN